jgi:murein DD-endopeptidase MepM/ murein hydrolase activator NlpD
MPLLFSAALVVSVPAQTADITVSMKARQVQPGELVRLTVTTPAPMDDLRVRAFDRAVTPYRVDSRTWGVLVGIDLDVKPGSYAVAIEAGGTTPPTVRTHPLVVTDRAFPTRRLTVAPAFVNPPPAVLTRIAEEARVLEALWGSSPEPRWTGAFIRPVQHAANSAFGSRSVFNGEARSPHGGADFASPAGTPVRAPSAGRVTLARSLYYTGNTVVLDHGAGLVSLFAHLSDIDVTEGDDVIANTVLGAVGATGRVTGPHLHWTVRASGARVDPLSLLAVMADDRR